MIVPPTTFPWEKLSIDYVTGTPIPSLSRSWKFVMEVTVFVELPAIVRS
jgi:hypothetical protein